ncbi:site-specific integrase [Nostoc sp. CHAB 5784]|uniref:tyrosine-type recombinase/integrase n=1 Tax=Nostoc mirabile TaxID=2907820 RepID=UPI001F3B4961|nr:site-specific integrase [Nostoc mirabile]MCC5665772.1 site-specific integrase [Nostoc mirabile CHAB5784]
MKLWTPNQHLDNGRFIRPLAKILESPLPNPPRCIGEGARFQVSPLYKGGLRGVYSTYARGLLYKKSGERIVYLPEAGVQAVLDLLLIRGKAPGSLFYPLNKANKIIHRRMSEQGVLRALRRHGEKADVEAFTPDDFKRTFIGNLLDAGADIVTVAKLAGHASPNTTSKYDRRGEAAKKRAIDLLNVLYNRRKNG